MLRVRCQGLLKPYVSCKSMHRSMVINDQLDIHYKTFGFNRKNLSFRGKTVGKASKSSKIFVATLVSCLKLNCLNQKNAPCSFLVLVDAQMLTIASHRWGWYQSGSTELSGFNVWLTTTLQHLKIFSWQIRAQSLKLDF